MGLTTGKNYRLLVYGNTLMIVCTGAAVAGGVLFWLLPSDLGLSYSVIMATGRAIRAILVERIILLYLVTSVFIVLGVAVIHLFYSHRIAGPLYRLGLEATKIASGDLSRRIVLRRKDALTDIAELLDHFSASYGGRLELMGENLVAIESQLAVISGLVERGSFDEDLSQAVNRLKEHSQKVEDGFRS